MNGTQKIIKYGAIAFGAFLALTIISSIMFAIFIGGSVLFGIDMHGGSGEVIQDRVIITEHVYDLDITVGVSRFEIRTGDEFEVVLNNVSDDTRVNVDGYTLRIEDGRRGGIRLFGVNVNNQEIIVYVPEGMEFRNATIDSGVGTVDIRTLTASTVNFRLGVGETKIDNLVSRENTRIESGVGRLEIRAGEIRNLNLNSGVGESIITAELTGNNRVDNGIGRTELNIAGDLEDFTLNTSTGIGSVRLNGERQSSGTHGSGENRLEISGGVGAIDIMIRR